MLLIKYFLILGTTRQRSNKTKAIKKLKKAEKKKKGKNGDIQLRIYT